ncbi:MAG: beta (1-6) glucans synthase [Gammaproteobacteria bacterium]|nr:beta (1-6) glucans synthase [Gammaproteobacteria bacterium]
MSTLAPRLLPPLAAVALVALAALAFWAWLGRPIPLPDAPGGKFECLSYTPYRGSQTPFDKAFVVPKSQIEDDLAHLADTTRCVRTYSAMQGLDAVAEVAPHHGLDVLLGIWIGREAKDNALEIEAAVRAAQAHPERVKAIVVGNETLLRRELTGAQLIAEIEKVRARTSVPLTYADVWEFWLKHPEVAAHVDFLTVHILPYWEDEPVSIEASLAHVQAVLDKVKAAFPGKRILVGETGWPSEGRSREQAAPGRVEQARFVREFVQLALRNDVRYNLIEAFDQPWKRTLEGTVGGYWGLFSEGREAKWPLVGPVSEHPHWPLAAGLATAAALAVVGYGVIRRRVLPFARWLALALLGGVWGSALVLQWRLVAAASKHPLEWSFYLVLLAASALAWLSLAARVAAPTGPWTDALPASLESVRAWLRRPRRAALDPSLALGIAHGTLGVATAAIALALAFDARYRDFPIAIVLPAALALLARTGARGLTTAGSMERALGWVMLACVPAGLVIEQGFVNREAVAWAATVALAAWPWVAPARRPSG